MYVRCGGSPKAVFSLPSFSALYRKLSQNHDDANRDSSSPHPGGLDRFVLQFTCRFFYILPLPIARPPPPCIFHLPSSFVIRGKRWQSRRCLPSLRPSSAWYGVFPPISLPCLYSVLQLNVPFPRVPGRNCERHDPRMYVSSSRTFSASSNPWRMLDVSPHQRSIYHLSADSMAADSTLNRLGVGAAYGTAKSGIGIAGVGTFRPDLIMKVGDALSIASCGPLLT